MLVKERISARLLNDEIKANLCLAVTSHGIPLISEPAVISFLFIINFSRESCLKGRLVLMEIFYFIFSVYGFVSHGNKIIIQTQRET